jgi:hypothetical protein
MRGLRIPVLVLATLIVAGCAALRGSAPGPLVPSLRAATAGDTVWMMLQVTNASERAVALRHRTGQAFDFEVAREGRRLWRWSDDQAFTQALWTDSLAPGETRMYEAAWAPGSIPPGAYRLTGRLTAERGDVSASLVLHVDP